VLCFCFVCPRLVYPVLPVSLGCLFVIAPSVISNVYLTAAQRNVFKESCDEHVALYNDCYNDSYAVRNSTKGVLNVQGAYHSSYIAPFIIYGQTLLGNVELIKKNI